LRNPEKPDVAVVYQVRKSAMGDSMGEVGRDQIEWSILINLDFFLNTVRRHWRDLNKGVT
jgi:hypothetical protein